jgi:hypothetical protein
MWVHKALGDVVGNLCLTLCSGALRTLAGAAWGAGYPWDLGQGHPQWAAVAVAVT